MSFTTNWHELGSPKLTAQAKRYLQARGISEEVSKLNNLRSLTPAETAALWGKDCRYESLLVPYSKAYGSARVFGLPSDAGKFRTTPGKGSRLYEPTLPRAFRERSWDDIHADTRFDLYGVEGTFKTLSAISQGILAIGISGCWNWQKGRQPIPGLRKFVWLKRRVTPLFDADITENNYVLIPFLLFGDWLGHEGAHTQFVQIPPIAGITTGIDDYLVKHGKKKFELLPRANWDTSDTVEQLRTSAMRTTEGGLASLFALQYNRDVRYDNDEECWYAWNGTLWTPQPKRAPDVQERMKDTVGWIIEEANKVQNAARRKSMLQWAIKCDKKPVIRGAMDLASSDPRLRVAMADLDSDPWLLGTHSGIIDLRSGKIIRAVREHMVTRSVAVAFDPDAECPRWRKFIAETMCNDEPMIKFMRRLVGYFLIGGNPLRLIFFLYGVGRNGKSVFIETLLKLTGDYGEPAKSELIMKHRADRDSESAQPFMLKLRGKRYITASEVDEGMQLDAAVVKTLTGGDEITVRGLHASPVKFTVEGKFVIRCNHRPIIDGADQAIWDRVVEIPFENRVKDGAEDTALRSTLNNEMPGILNWALRGCLYYEENGLRLPEKVRKQITAYRDSMDTVTQWHEDHIDAANNARTRSNVLYFDYEAWCSRRSARVPTFPVSQKAFGMKLREKGYGRIKSDGNQVWCGLRLKGST